MARSIERDHWDEVEYLVFGEQLRRDLAALDMVLSRDGFGEGPASIGAELELTLVDANGLALLRGPDVLARAGDRRLAPELNRFNLELNLDPVPAAGRPFSTLQHEIEGGLEMIRAAAAPDGGRVVTVGILPTLRPPDVSSSALTDLPRYRALSAAIRRLRQGPVELKISGDDPLDLVWDDITVEGANTSFQVHLRVPPRRFAAMYNAAQLAAPLAVAVGANSPIFLQHRLWDETRVALFKQSLDDRAFDPSRWHPPARVSYGNGWVREGIHELFVEAVAVHPPLFPEAEHENAIAVARSGRLPSLEALRLHQGTVWRWNRAIYDPAGGGHVRIEFRALPGGPTPVDMVANAAYLLGLTMGLEPQMRLIAASFPFRYAEYNFYRAAQRGLDAELLWPTEAAPSPRPCPAVELINRTLPLAHQGLERLGVDGGEARRLLDVIRGRLATGLTGARWQRANLGGKGRATPDQLSTMLEQYLANAGSGRPVHEWNGVH